MSSHQEIVSSLQDSDSNNIASSSPVVSSTCDNDYYLNFNNYNYNFLSSLNSLFTSNLLWAEWISFSTSVSLLGILIIYHSNLVPETVQRVFKYGKAADLHVTGLKNHTIELPKRWFYQFYLFASIFYTFLIYSVITMYVYGSKMPSGLKLIMDNFVGSNKSRVNYLSPISPESVILASILILIQVTRRLSECTFLSVYSNAKMNIVHYIFGFSFYFGVGLSVIAEAPGFVGGSGAAISPGGSIKLSNFLLNANFLIGIIMFTFGSILQFQSHRILANLRKDTKGNVVTLEHSIPRGSLFNYISCPHYFAEILIYMSLNVIFGGKSATWWMVCTFVITNQIIVGLFNHHWYHQSFTNYPKSRKAVIPFLL